MTRTLGLVMALLSVMLVLAGCGGNGKENPQFDVLPSDGLEIPAEVDALPEVEPDLPPDTTPPPDIKPEEVACQPACEGRECGDDGCGGSCGECEDWEECSDAGQCGPPASCKGYTWEGCCEGGALKYCDADGMVYVVDCEDSPECGWNGDGGYYDCGTDGSPGPGEFPQYCPGCEPSCEDKECGGDGCGGSCGECGDQSVCVAGKCVVPLPCGDIAWEGCCDGPVLTYCDEGQIVTVDCAENLECGWSAQDGYYDCGTEGSPDPSGEFPLDCPGCDPSCEGKECGDDGCGGSCGVCAEGFVCEEFLCEPVPQECGDVSWAGCCDGETLKYCLEGQLYTVDCTGNPSCGWSEEEQYYDCGTEGAADPSGEFPFFCECTPACEGKMCGPDGCGGSCGECLGWQEECVDGQCLCIPACAQWMQCGDDGCGGACGVCVGPNEQCFDHQCVCVPSCFPPDVDLEDDWVPDPYECGDDGCGGSCGVCIGLQEVCMDHVCACIPDCNGKVCGDDGCGGSCGECQNVQEVCAEGICICMPACVGKVCGDDGCGGACGMCAGPQDQCQDGQCVCVPDCTGKVCGGDGCGGSCGECTGPQDVCVSGQCVCAPACLGKQCGEDGCGGVCGTCLGPLDACIGGLCVCQPDCTGKVCGEDGCGGSCGACPGPQDACVSGQCVCQPACAGKMCGEDGCGGSCGTCKGPQDACVNGLCVCQPKCEGKQCGPDGCGGSCGTCPGPQDACIKHQCVCQPACAGKVCGPDGCGGQCGPACPGPQDACVNGLCVCQPACNGKDCGPDGCGGLCGPDCGKGKVCLDGLCTGAGAVCGSLPATNCCDGEKLAYCASGHVKILDCTAWPKCGWHKGLGWYDCSTDGGTDPSGLNPKECW